MKKEANWLSIRRKIQIDCQIDERVNQPPMIREAIKKRLSFGHFSKVALTPSLILDIREVTFVSAFLDNREVTFVKGQKFKYLPNI